MASREPVDAPEGSLVLFAAPPGKIVRDGGGDLSLFMGELAKELERERHALVARVAGAPHQTTYDFKTLARQGDVG